MQYPVADITENVPVSIRWTTDGGGYFREIREPGADLSDLLADMQADITAHWAQADVAAWKAEQDAIFARGPVTADDVAAERARRFAQGFDYDFGDARGVHHFGTTDADMKGWDEVTKMAQALLNAGDTSTTIDIETATGSAAVTAPEWNAIILHSGQVRQPLWQASFALQAMDPIPADYTADSYWPAAA